MAKAVVVIGGGAQAKYALETFRLTDVPVAGVIDANHEPEVSWPTIYGCRVFGSRGDIRSVLSEVAAENALVCMPSGEDRERLWHVVREVGLEAVGAIHPRACVATTARIGSGVIINAGAIIQPFATVGDGVMIHANATIEHDDVIEDFATICPGVTLAGWVRVARYATVYTGATVVPGRTIGSKAVVGAGAAVISDVSPGSTAAGVPARVLDG